MPKNSSISLNAAQRTSTNDINTSNYRQNLDKFKIGISRREED